MTNPRRGMAGPRAADPSANDPGDWSGLRSGACLPRLFRRQPGFRIWKDAQESAPARQLVDVVGAAACPARAAPPPPPTIVRGQPSCPRSIGRVGQGEAEGRALTEGALDRDRAALRLHELLDDVQPQPAAILVAAALAAVEALEDAVELLRRDTDPGVGDGDLEHAVAPL